IDSILRVYDSAGKLLAYYGQPAINDDQFEPPDSTVIDLVLPGDGIYYVEVDTFHLHDDALFGPLGLTPKPDIYDDMSTGTYELFIYRFSTSSLSNAPNLLDG